MVSEDIQKHINDFHEECELEEKKAERKKVKNGRPDKNKF